MRTISKREGHLKTTNKGICTDFLETYSNRRDVSRKNKQGGEEMVRRGTKEDEKHLEWEAQAHSPS